MNGFSLPFYLATAGVHLPVACYESWTRVIQDHLSCQEARLQQKLLDPDGRGDVARILPRITCISAATRAFLSWNRHLTLLSDNPAFRMQELAALAQWLRAFKTAERELIHALHVPLSEWRRNGSFRDELGALAETDHTVFGKIQALSALPPSLHEPITQQLCGQLMDAHARHQSEQQQQMS